MASQQSQQISSCNLHSSVAFAANLRDCIGKVTRMKITTLYGTNISHLGKRKIIFKSALVRDMLVPRRVKQKVWL